MEYKGFKILRASGYSGGYQIHKDNILFSQLILISQDICKKVIDTYLRRCGGENIPLINQKFKVHKTMPKETITNREVYLSEHEKYIEKLLTEK